MTDTAIFTRETALSAQSRLWLQSGVLLFFLVVSFLLQAFFFTTEFRPDEYDAFDFFVGIFAGADRGLDAEIWTRLCLFLFNLLVTGLLVGFNLIDRQTLIVAALWPLTVFLYSKIYWEFFVFPFMLIRYDSTTHQELKLIFFLILLFVVTGEGNVGVLVVYRGVLLMQKIRFLRWTPIVLIIIGLALDSLINSGLGGNLPIIGSYLTRFDWTRDIVNPEYSPFETIQVFLASFHFFSLHTGAYWIDAVFSLLVIALIAFNSNSRLLARNNIHLLLALVSVVFFFTHVTHAFQNARYYLFFLPIIASLVGERQLFALGVLSLTHVFFRWLGLGLES